MTEFNSQDPAVIRNARPAAATLQIVLEDGSTDTVELNPFWTAKFLKRLRQNGPHDISICGVVSAYSPEITPVNRSWAGYSIAISGHEWEGWLQGKPTP